MGLPGALHNQVALITGASRGIGRATALALSDRGARLALVQRGDAADVVDEVRESGCEAQSFEADLSRPEAAEAAVAAAIDSLGRVDVLVANAGTIHRQPALEVDLEDWRRVIDLNLTSVFALSQAVARHLVTAGREGRIIHVASVLAFQGGINVSSYAASKGALVQLTRALANEWAGYGITVNAVAPGYVETEITEPLRADQARRAQIDARIPAGRWAEPQDIAGAIAYLASAEAAYVNGHTLVVDGGWLAR
jgi:2-deoxy-D-gluconate 3-dehydrogenase